MRLRLVVVVAVLALGCTADSKAKRPDGGWCYWAPDLIKTEAQCECIYTCHGCCTPKGECWPLGAGQTACPRGSVAGIFRL